MTRHSQHIIAFVASLQRDTILSREEKGRQLYEAIDFLEEVLGEGGYPDPRQEGVDDDD